jgi:hypothetical protein
MVVLVPLCSVLQVALRILRFGVTLVLLKI